MRGKTAGRGAQRPQKRLTNGVSGVKCDGRWRTNLQPGELGVLLGAPNARALPVGHLDCAVGRLLGRVRDYTPRAPGRRRAKANAAGVPKTSLTKKRQQLKRASSRSFAAREHRTDGRTPTWARLRSDLAVRRGLKVLSTFTRARFGRGGATTNAFEKKQQLC